MANPALNAQERVILQRVYQQASSQVNTPVHKRESVVGLQSLLRLCNATHLLSVLSDGVDEEGKYRHGRDSFFAPSHNSIRYHAHALFMEWGIVKLVTSRLTELLQCPVDDVVTEPVEICVGIFYQLIGSAGDVGNLSTPYWDVFFEFGVPGLMKDVLVRFAERAPLASVVVNSLLCLVTKDPERIVRTVADHDITLPGEGVYYFGSRDVQALVARKEILQAVQHCLQKHMDKESLVLTCCLFFQRTRHNWMEDDLASSNIHKDLFKVLAQYYNHKSVIPSSALFVLDDISQVVRPGRPGSSSLYTTEHFRLLLHLLSKEGDAFSSGQKEVAGYQMEKILGLLFRFLPSVKPDVIVESKAATILTMALKVCRCSLPNCVAWIIMNLQTLVSGDSPLTDVLIKAGAHQEVVTCMETFSSKVSVAGSGAIFLWMLASDGISKKALFQCGTLPLLITILQTFHNNRRVMYNSLGLAGSLTFADAELRGDFLAVPYIPALKNVLLVQHHSGDVVRSGIASLIMLVRRQDILMELAWSGFAHLLYKFVVPILFGMEEQAKRNISSEEVVKGIPVLLCHELPSNDLFYLHPSYHLVLYIYLAMVQALLDHSTNSRVQRCGITLIGHLSCHVVAANAAPASLQTEEFSYVDGTPVDGGSDIETDAASLGSTSFKSAGGVEHNDIYTDGSATMGSMQCSARTDPYHSCWQLPRCAPVGEDLLHVSRLHGLNAQLCSNCKDKESLTREVIMSLNRLSVDDYQVLTDRGWFRRGSKPLYQYRHVHESRCGTYDTRTDVQQFDPNSSKTYRRVLKRCRRAGIQVETVEPSFRQDAYELYNSYQVTKHDKPRKTPDGYRAHAIDTPIQPCMRAGIRYGTVHQLYWMDGHLIGVGVLDVLPRTLVSVYMYYDVARPEVAHLSLGVYAALQEISYAQYLNKMLGADIAYYTMGGFSPLNDKLSYKACYGPVQYLASWASSLWMDSLQTCYILAELNRVRQQLRALRLDFDADLKKARALEKLNRDVSLLRSPTSETMHNLPSSPQPVTVQHLVEAILEEPLQSACSDDVPNTVGALLLLLQKHIPLSLSSKVSIFPALAASGGGKGSRHADKDGCSELNVTAETELDVNTLYCGLVAHSQTTGDIHQILFRLPNGQLLRFKELSSLCQSLTSSCLEILHHSVAALASGLGESLASRTVIDLAWITCSLGRPFDTDV